MRKLLTLAIPMLLGVGLLTAAVHSDPDEQSKRSQGGVTAAPSKPAVIEEAAAPATTTTTAAPETTTTTAAPTTTTTAAPTTTTTRKVTPVTSKPRPRLTTTTTAPAPSQAAAQPQVIDCGTGSASAKANLVPLGNGRYGLTVTVLNDSTKAIELDELVVTADYADGSKKQFSAPVAGKRVGARPEPNEITISIPESEGPNAPNNFVISDFRFHTAGLPECASH